MTRGCVSMIYTYYCILYVYIHYDNLHTVHPSIKIDCTHVTKMLHTLNTVYLHTNVCMYVDNG